MQDYEILADQTAWPQYYGFDSLFLNDLVESTPTNLNAPYTGYFNANGDIDYFVVEISAGNHSLFLLPDLVVLGDYNEFWWDPSAVPFDTLKQETDGGIQLWEILEYHGQYSLARYGDTLQGLYSTDKTDTIAEAMATQNGWYAYDIRFSQLDIYIETAAGQVDANGYTHTGKFVIEVFGSPSDWYYQAGYDQQDAGRYLLTFDQSTGLREATWGQDWINFLPGDLTSTNHAPELGVPSISGYIDTAGEDTFDNALGSLVGFDEDGDPLTYGISGGTDSGNEVFKTGSYGTLTVNKTTGAFTYDPLDFKIEGLKALTSEAFTVTVADGELSASTLWEVGIWGAEDPTTFDVFVYGPVAEDGTTDTYGSIDVVDRDNGDDAIVPQTDTAGTYGSFSIGSNGLWTYFLNNDADNVQALASGEAVTDTFSVSTAGGASQEVTITINGVNEAGEPVGVGDWNNLDFLDPDVVLPDGLAAVEENQGEGKSGLPFAPDEDTEVFTTPHFDFDPASGYSTKEDGLFEVGKEYLAEVVTASLTDHMQQTMESLAEDMFGPYAANLNIAGMFKVNEFKNIWKESFFNTWDGLEKHIYDFGTQKENARDFAEWDRRNTEDWNQTNEELVEVATGELVGDGDSEPEGGFQQFIDGFFEKIGRKISETNSFTVSLVVNQNGEGIQLIGDDKKDILVGVFGDDELAGLGDDDVLMGGNGNDKLYGGDGNDKLSGGAGVDTMEGGAGDDLYIVDDAGDQVVEAAGGGTDTIASYLSYTLDDQLENLILLGEAAINGNGNAYSNTLIGNDGANTLTGGVGKDKAIDTLSGGLGADTLYGGKNAGDIFVFDSALGSGNVDRLADFKKDMIVLDIDIFTSLNAGALPSDQFVYIKKGAVAAADANDYILYSKADGTLYYDADGSGPGEAVAFASFSGKISASSISVADWGGV